MEKIKGGGLMDIRSLFAAAALAVVGWWGCGVVWAAAPRPVQPSTHDVQRFEYTTMAMGVRTRAVIYASDEALAADAAKAAFALIATIEEEISDYRTDNPLAHVHAQAGSGVPVPIGPHFASVLRTSLDIAEATNGAFNPALGAPVGLWRQMRASGQPIPAPQIVAATSAARISNVRLNASETVDLLHPATRLDFGGIGKGYAAECAGHLLESRGIQSFLISLSGDVVVGAAPPGSAGWEIALEGIEGLPSGTLTLSNAAVSTSGDTTQLVTIDGVRYSHILDPATGMGLTQPVVATIVAPSGTLADALVTAACVAGPAAIAAFPQARWRIERGTGVEASPDFPNLAKPQPAAQDDVTQRLAQRLAWFKHDRFGMFIHWGLYAIPAGEWNGEKVGGTGEWIMHNAKIPPAEYEPLAARFNPVNFDAKAWIAAAKGAGMKYVVTTTKHHDGFCLFDSAFGTYDIMDASPFKRDIMKELADEIRVQGLRLGWYHSIWDWHHQDGKGDRFPLYAKVLKQQVGEILTNYGKVDVVWFDGEWTEEWTEAQGVEMYAYCRSLQPEALINNRVGKGRDDMRGLTKGKAVGDFGTPEQQVPGGTVTAEAWESCMTMNDTWGFRTDDHNWKSSDQLIRTLIDSVSKGGNYLLNVGPTADGRIPAESLERLAAIGAWMNINSDSIYGCGEAASGSPPAWGRMTRQGDRLFVHIFDWPKDGRIQLAGLDADLKGGRVLGSEATVHLTKSDGDWILAAPHVVPHTASTVFEFQVRGEVTISTLR